MSKKNVTCGSRFDRLVAGTTHKGTYTLPIPEPAMLALSGDVLLRRRRR